MTLRGGRRFVLAIGVLAMLVAPGCGRRGPIADEDLTQIRPTWTMNDVIREFGPTTPSEIPMLAYPGVDPDEEYVFFFERAAPSRIIEVFKLTRKDAGRQVRVWPPPGAKP